jgi:DNA-directed RNA polymerase subunit RPC12/RpoP
LNLIINKLKNLEDKISCIKNPNDEYNAILFDMLGIIEEIVADVSDLNKNYDEINDYVTVLDENLGNIEEELFGFEVEESEFEDFEYLDISCEVCGEQIAIEKSLLNEGSSLECPNCHNKIKF